MDDHPVSEKRMGDDRSRADRNIAADPHVGPMTLPAAMTVPLLIRLSGRNGSGL
jgi:hypothetical protein